jgi:membrane-bound serine protease (ClpP class)
MNHTHKFHSIIRILLPVLSGFLFTLTVLAQTSEVSDTSKLVYRFDIRKEIGPAIWRQTKQAIEEAEKMNADLILIHLNTYGGLVESADSIRTKILNTKVKTVVFIDNNAASAGALISIACDRIYMHSGSNIGAATVVNQTAEALPDKYQSYMRSMMRSTAEAKGRDPRIAEAMVDPTLYIEGVSDSGKVLTFTTSEAIKHGFCDGEANTIKEVLSAEGITQYTTHEYKATFIESIIGFFVNPAVSGILIMVIVMGIYFELQTPGVGFPLLAALVAAILYFAPLYLEGLAANWEIILFFVGVGLLAVEIFVLPGFGISGITGVALIVTSLTISLIENDGFDFKGISIPDVFKPLTIVTFSMLLSFVISVILGKKFMGTGAFKRLVLADVQDSHLGYISSEENLRSLVGEKGTAKSMLRPSGKVEIGGEIYNATAEVAFIEKGTQIVVTRFDDMNLMVNKNPDTKSESPS